jgi:hypothetical protein
MKDEVTDSLKNALSERMRHPFFGAFAISFVVKNWQFFYTLLRGSRGAAGSIKYAIVTLHSETCWWWLAPAVAATAYAALSEWVGYPFRWMQQQATIYSENKLRDQADEHFKLTATTLERHSKYLALGRRNAVLENRLKANWIVLSNSVNNTISAPLSLTTNGDLRILDTVEPVSDDDLPALFFPVNIQSSPSPVVQVTEESAVNFEMSFCGFVCLGENEILGVPNGGLIPVAWRESRSLVFDHGRVVPYRRNEEPSPGPRIDFVSEGLGVFRGIKPKRS